MGATLNRKFTLQENVKLCGRSFDNGAGNFPDTRGDGSPLGIEFTVQTPTGRIGRHKRLYRLYKIHNIKYDPNN